MCREKKNDLPQACKDQVFRTQHEVSGSGSQHCLTEKHKAKESSKIFETCKDQMFRAESCACSLAVTRGILVSFFSSAY